MMNTPNFRDVLYGIAVADAIGNPLEFKDLVTNQDFQDSVGRDVLRVSDDTQMTLFCAEALLLALQANGEVSAGDLEVGYLRWYQTQNHTTSHGNGLLQFQSLYAAEAPGKTCMRSLTTLASGRAVHNDSKGNGSVMRAAPFAFAAKLFGKPDEWALTLAAMDARTTHLHPNAAGASVQLTAIYLQLLAGVELIPAIRNAVEACTDIVPEEVTQACLDALEDTLALDKMQGWIAEEALALASRAVMRERTYLKVVEEACCYGTGVDSDSVAGIAGGLAAAGGLLAPSELVAKLNALGAINYVADLYQY